MSTTNNLNASIIDESYLKNYKEFVKIDNTYYGGHQKWFFSEKYTSKFLSKRFCGVVAVSNVFHYMSRYNKEIKMNQDNINISKDNFLQYSMLIYKFVSPRLYGIPTVSMMKKGLKKFAKSININIETFELINPSNIFETVEFIKKAMDNNSPIMMVTLNSKIENLEYHWVTITGCYKTTSEENFIITSNWGKKEIFNLDNWLEDRSIYKGLLYFSIPGKV